MANATTPVIQINEGNVGIATTNPKYKLQVGDYNTGDGNITMKANGTGADEGAELTFNMQVGGGQSNSYIAQIVPISYDSLASNNNSLNFKVGAWNNNADAGASKMSILANGKVGIGTTNPSVELQVEGHGIFNGSLIINENLESLRLGTTAASGGTYQTWHNASGRKGFFGYGATVNDTIYLVNDENSTIQLGTNGRTADFIVSADGNIGLGITSPGVKLVTIEQGYSEGPTLGSGVVGGQALLGENGLFGQYSGVSGTTGSVWHQVQRNNTATAYNMILQPAGGNVGIGTTNPSDKLVVQGDGNGILVKSNDFTLSRIIPRGGTSTNWDKGLFSLYNAATESVRIDTAGSSWFNGGFVGIGTTNPGNKLHVENTVSSSWTTRFSNTTANSNNIYFGYNNGTTSYGMYIDGGQGAAGYDIQTLGGFVVRGDGKVGIGLTNPSYNLDVSGTGRFTNTLNVNSSALAAYLYSSQSIGLRVRGGGNSQDITQFQNVGGSTVIAIDNAGKIGMNVTDPVATLDMISTTGGYSSIVQQMEIPSYGTGIIFNRSASGSYNYTAQTFKYNGSTVGGIQINTSSTSFNTTSDYRLKENREKISDAIERVKELRPIKFNWIKEPGKSKVDGFYAHELAEVVPEAVTGEKDALDWEGNPHYQSIDQAKIVPLLTAALQQAISKIEQLETRIQILENK